MVGALATPPATAYCAPSGIFASASFLCRFSGRSRRSLETPVSLVGGLDSTGERLSSIPGCIVDRPATFRMARMGIGRGMRIGAPCLRSERSTRTPVRQSSGDQPRRIVAVRYFMAGKARCDSVGCQCSAIAPSDTDQCRRSGRLALEPRRRDQQKRDYRSRVTHSDVDRFRYPSSSGTCCSNSPCRRPAGALVVLSLRS